MRARCGALYLNLTDLPFALNTALWGRTGHSEL